MQNGDSISLVYGKPITQKDYNSFISGTPLDFNGHKVQLTDGDTIKVDGQKIRIKGGDTYETQFNPQTKIMPSGDELYRGTKAKHVTARQLLSNITDVNYTGQTTKDRELAWLTVKDPNKTVQDFKILDKPLEGGYAKVWTGDGIAEANRERALLNKSMNVASNVLNRNPNVTQLLSTKPSMNNAAFVEPTQEQLDYARNEYEKSTNASNYLIGTQQVINKVFGDGIIGSIMRAGSEDEPSYLSRLSEKARQAYKDNEAELEKIKAYRSEMGMGTSDLTASSIAPELISELGLLIPAAGQVGAGIKAIGAADKISKLGRTGKVIEEATKWGLAEAPVSALLGHQDEIGQRMAMSAFGAGVIEGAIQGIGHVAGKIRGSDALKTKESVISGADDVAPVISPEIRPSSTAKTLDDDFTSTVSHADTNSEFMKKINSGKFDKWSY